MHSSDYHLPHKVTLTRQLYQLANASAASLSDELKALYHPDAEWRGSAPLDEMQGVEAIEAQVWRPLLDAFSLLERRDTLALAGHYQGDDQVALMGHFCGVFENDWLGIPASGRPVYLRYGEVHSLVDGRISRSTVLLDVLDLMRQAGCWPVAPSVGTELHWPGPLTGDGMVFDASDPAESEASLAQTLAMHATLAAYDDSCDGGRAGLLSMPQREHWHPKMMWYGPAGIGTTRGLAGFVDHHQLPFRRAFPNRRAGNHYVRIGDGKFSVTGGWPSVNATHSGGGFMGTSPTGRDVQMRVMDFYLHHEGLIRENWVPLDIIHLLKQMDIDVFDRLSQVLRRPR